MPPTIPEWCEVRRGGGRLLLVAPHGGRRPPVDPSAPPANLRVNDVHTPEITRELAARADAGLIINHGMDRNDLDLNRASQVRRRAPWLLELLREEVAAIVCRHGRAEVVFIHGWNNGQLKCDIGLGGVERDGDLDIAAGAALSVSRSYLETQVRAFQAACARQGIAASIGEKYPASHPNNLVQVMAASGLAVDALQLELSLPLRCPGPWREGFVSAAAECFGDLRADGARRSAAHGGASPRRAPRSAALQGPGTTQRGEAATSLSSDVPAPESLQCYDPASDIGLFAGVGRMGATVGGRLLLFLGGQRIALFTGEGVGGVPPLRIARAEGGLSLRFDGPILAMQDAAEYLDLEAALAASRAVEASVDIAFEETHHAEGGTTFGRVRGEVTVEGRTHELTAHGFGRIAPLRASGASGQTMLAASFAGARGLVGRALAGVEASAGTLFADGVSQPLEDLHLHVVRDGDAWTPAGFELRAAHHPLLRARTMSRMAILRSAPHGYLRVAFGVAHFDWAGLEGWGLYEHALPLPALKPA